MAYEINNGWSEKRRKKQAATARKNKPWQKSTGPKTAAGKDAIKTNAMKHGLCTPEGQSLRRMIRTLDKVTDGIFIEAIRDLHYERQRQLNRRQKMQAALDRFT